MLKLLLVGLGGMIGALARYGVVGLCNRAGDVGSLYATLIVNVAGCFLIGLLAAAIGTRDWLSPEWRLLLIVGLLGSFTTFSTFGYETFELWRAGRWLAAFGNVSLHVIIGLAAVIAGYALLAATIVKPPT